MKPEMYLDHLLKKREIGESQLPEFNAETAASLAAAEALTQLQSVEVPSEFAQRLELSIRARARVQNASQRLDRHAPTGPLRRATNPLYLRRLRTWASIGIAAMLVLAFAGLGLMTASAGSLPGDPLFGLKQAGNQFTITLASNPQNRATAESEQLHTALLDLKAAVNDKRDDTSIQQALTIVALSTKDNQQAVAALPPGAERETAQQNLQSSLAEEDQLIRSLLNRVDWSIRLNLTRQLGVLGDPVPGITHALIQMQKSGTLLLTLTGAHFAPQAQLLIDGQVRGTITQITSGRLVAVISHSTWSPGAHALGILNPDGTAAQLVLRGDDTQDDQEGQNTTTSTPTPSHTTTPTPLRTPTPGSDDQGGQHKTTGTPTPSPTRTPGNDN